MMSYGVTVPNLQGEVKENFEYYLPKKPRNCHFSLYNAVIKTSAAF